MEIQINKVLLYMVVILVTLRTMEVDDEIEEDKFRGIKGTLTKLSALQQLYTSQFGTMDN